MKRYFCSICSSEIIEALVNIESEKEIICDECLSVLHPYMGGYEEGDI